MPRRNDRSGRGRTDRARRRADHGGPARRETAQAPGRQPATAGGAGGQARGGKGPGLNVILTTHARRQLEELGPPAHAALRFLEAMEPGELAWTAERLPPQHGREVWMLWAGSVRVLLDLEDDDLTVQGFGLRPRR